MKKLADEVTTAVAEKMDQCVAARGETLLDGGEAESKNEHGDSRQLGESDTHERNKNEDMMDDAEDLECAPGSSGDVRIATIVKPSRPDGRAHPCGRRRPRDETPVCISRSQISRSRS